MISDAHADMLATAIPAFLGIDFPGQQLGELLLLANVLSVRTRYADRHGIAAAGEAQAAAYRYRPWMGNIEPGFLGKQACCAAYQCDEWEGFETSTIGKLIAQLIEVSGVDLCNLPEEYPWGIDCHPGEDIKPEPAPEPHGPEPLPPIPVLEHAEPQGSFAFRW